MAFTTIIRSSASRVLPLAARLFRDQRLNQTLFSAVTRTDLSEKSVAGLSFVRCCSALAVKKSDDLLLRVIESEIKCAEETEELSQAEEAIVIPEGFPFKIEDHPGLQTVCLSREYQGETIEVEVSMPDLVTGENEDDDDDDNGDSEKPNQSCIPLVVRVSKQGKSRLEFGCTAYPDEIIIDSLSVKDAGSSEDQIPYEGPEFSDLDENLQKAFHKYLEVRGIKPSATNFLHEYMVNKDSKEYKNWLKDLKKFVQA